MSYLIRKLYMWHFRCETALRHIMGYSHDITNVPEIQNHLSRERFAWGPDETSHSPSWSTPGDLK